MVKKKEKKIIKETLQQITLHKLSLVTDTLDTDLFQ